ncbi:hypothetical protein D3C76_1794740 [compost metagenome]
MVTYHHLKLATAFHDHDDARVFLQRIRIRLTVFLQLKTQTGGAMHQAFHIVAATDAGQDLTG